ncbi:MAG: membrane protein [Planctomycetota bacterium]|nr:MAG: membrane protein [Planctomycetota bacterium]
MKALHSLRRDLPASVVVFFVAVPLCLGIALASGAPLLSGLIAGIIGGIVVGAASGSSIGVSGPAAGLAVIVLNAIDELGGFAPFLAALVLAGVFQLIFGLLRGGMIGYFVPTSVIKGMLAGIGIIIVLKQIPHAFGYDGDFEGDQSFFQPDGGTTLSTLQRMFDYVEPGAILVTLVSLVLLISWERVFAKRWKLFKVLPGPLAAVLFGIVFQIVASRWIPSFALSSEHLVSVPVLDSFAEYSDVLVLPQWSALGSPAVWVTALTIAIVASIETLLCVAATDKLDPERHITPTNRELIAQGVGNAASGLIGGLPVTQVIVRSSANIQSGGQTKLSPILHGVWLLVFVTLLPGVLNLIPLAVLAAILFTVGYKLATPKLFREMFALGKGQFVPFLSTIVGIVFTDLLTGIGIGMALAAFSILRANFRNAHFLHIEEADQAGKPHSVRMRLSEEVSFLNKGAVIKQLAALPDGSQVSIDMSGCVSIDHDIIEAVDDFIASAPSRSIEVTVIEQRPVDMRLLASA